MDSGQEDLKQIADKDDEPLSEDLDDYEEIPDQDEEHRHELAGKFVSFFTHSDETNFWLFIECGVKRTFTVLPVYDSTYLELSIFIPVPDDDLLHFAGIKHATEVEVEPTDELVYIKLPRKLSPKKVIKKFWPKQETPLYLIFKYELEIPEEIPEEQVDIDLTKLFKVNDESLGGKGTQ
jgi:hypothetical protein